MFFVSINKIRMGDFAKEEDAIHFIMEKLREDRHFKKAVTYSLYEGMDLLRNYSQDDLATSDRNQIDAEASGGSQRGSGKSFAPTPFNTTPRLGPQTWVKDVPKEDDDKDNK